MGRDKALLPAPEGGSLVRRAAELLGPYVDEVRLVGEREAYRGLPWPMLADSPAGIGPLGGLNALLEHASGRAALVLACDMPFVTPSDIEALLAPGRTAAPRRDGRWEPLCACYAADAGSVVAARVSADERRLQRLLDELDPAVVAIEPSHLRDWDCPEDMR